MEVGTIGSVRGAAKKIVRQIPGINALIKQRAR
jgi:hypothetical protein